MLKLDMKPKLTGDLTVTNDPPPQINRVAKMKRDVIRAKEALRDRLNAGEGRPPTGFSSWIIDEEGNLKGIMQHGVYRLTERGLCIFYPKADEMSDDSWETANEERERIQAIADELVDP